MNPKRLRVLLVPIVALICLQQVLFQNNHEYTLNFWNNKAVATSSSSSQYQELSSSQHHAERNNQTFVNVTHDRVVTELKTWPPQEVKEVYIYWVHVGKCGGTTLRDYLPIPFDAKWRSIPCMVNFTKEHAASDGSLQQALQKCYRKRGGRAKGAPILEHETHLSKAILCQFHRSALFKATDVGWILNHTNTFLYQIRSPVSRIVSTFNFHRAELMQSDAIGTTKPRNAYHGDHAVFYLDCFMNVEEMAQALIPNPDYNFTSNLTLTDTCTNLARSTVSGEKKSANMPHFSFGYQHYNSEMIDVKPDHYVVVIRMEHLWDDARYLDVALGGDGNFSHAGSRVTYGSENYAVKTGTSVEGAFAICCAIHKEIEAYQRIVLLAENLSKDQKLATLGYAFEECSIHIKSDWDVIASPFSWHQWHQSNC